MRTAVLGCGGERERRQAYLLRRLLEGAGLAVPQHLHRGAGRQQLRELRRELGEELVFEEGGLVGAAARLGARVGRVRLRGQRRQLPAPGLRLLPHFRRRHDVVVGDAEPELQRPDAGADRCRQIVRARAVQRGQGRGQALAQLLLLLPLVGGAAGGAVGLDAGLPLVERRQPRRLRRLRRGEALLLQRRPARSQRRPQQGNGASGGGQLGSGQRTAAGGRGPRAAARRRCRRGAAPPGTAARGRRRPARRAAAPRRRRRARCASASS